MTFTIATRTGSYHPLRTAAKSSPEKSNASAAEK